MKDSLAGLKPSSGTWRNGNIFYHFSPGKLTLLDFGHSNPQILFPHPHEIELPENGWEELSSDEFYVVMDSTMQLKFDRLKQWIAFTHLL